MMVTNYILENRITYIGPVCIGLFGISSCGELMKTETIYGMS
jgi:hypothetical protein